MATVCLGFMFADQSFFNCTVSKALWDELQKGQEGNFYLQNLAGEQASRHQINLSSDVVTDVTPGGLYPELNLAEGVLYLLKEAAAPAENAADAAHSGAASAAPAETETENGPLQAPSGGGTSSRQAGAASSSSSTQSESENQHWCHAAVLLLLETYQTFKNLFQKSTLKKMEVWKRISSEMSKYGHTFSHTACEKKWNNLRARYKTMDNHSTTGRGRTKWAYFDLMAEILARDPSVIPPITISVHSGPQVAEPTTPTTRPVPVPMPESSSQRSERTVLTPLQVTPEPVTLTGAHENESLTIVAASPSPRMKRGRKRRREEDDWFREFAQQTLDNQKKLREAMERKNDILEKFLEKM